MTRKRLRISGLARSLPNKKSVIFITIFAVVGLLAIILTKAITPTASVEPEDGSVSIPASSISTAGTSGGSYVKFGGSASGCPAGQFGSTGNCYVLSWQPPAMTNQVTYCVSDPNSNGSIVIKTMGAGATNCTGTPTNTNTVAANTVYYYGINATAGQDSRVIFETPLHKRLVMNGGEKWVIIGGEVNNDIAFPIDPNCPNSDNLQCSVDSQSALEFTGVAQNGVIYVEGFYARGQYGTDGIRIGGKSGNGPHIYIQNSRIVDRLSQSGQGQQAVSNPYHADIIQSYGNNMSLNVDHVTGRTDYQGQMWAMDADTSMTSFGPTTFKNVNYIHVSPSRGWLINFVMGEPVDDVSFTNVYVQPDYTSTTGSQFCNSLLPNPNSGATTTNHWNVVCDTDSGNGGRKRMRWGQCNIAPIPSGCTQTPTRIIGAVYEGAPPNGDFAPITLPGMNYDPTP